MFVRQLRKIISGLWRGRYHQQLNSIKEMILTMESNQQAQLEELRAAIRELNEALSQESGEINARLDAMQRKIDEAGAPIDLREEIAAIRRSSQAVSNLVVPEAEIDTSASAEETSQTVEQPASPAEEVATEPSGESPAESAS